MQMRLFGVWLPFAACRCMADAARLVAGGHAAFEDDLTFVAVPEPASVLLLGVLGAVAFGRPARCTRSRN